MKTFNGLDLHLGNLPRLSSAQSRSISAENPHGSRGGGARAEADPTGRSRLLGRGWKCRPYIWIEPNETVTLAEIEDAGTIQSIWTAGPMTRNVVLRMYWDDQEHPSVEVPLPDFFAVPGPCTTRATITSKAAAAAEPGSHRSIVFPSS